MDSPLKAPKHVGNSKSAFLPVDHHSGSESGPCDSPSSILSSVSPNSPTTPLNWKERKNMTRKPPPDPASTPNLHLCMQTCRVEGAGKVHEVDDSEAFLTKGGVRQRRCSLPLAMTTRHGHLSDSPVPRFHKPLVGPKPFDHLFPSHDSYANKDTNDEPDPAKTGSDSEEVSAQPWRTTEQSRRRAAEATEQRVLEKRKSKKKIIKLWQHSEPPRCDVHQEFMSHGVKVPDRKNFPTTKLSDIFFVSMSIDWKTFFWGLFGLFGITAAIFTLLFWLSGLHSAIASESLVEQFLRLFGFCLCKVSTGSSDGFEIDITHSNPIALIIYHTLGFVSLMFQVILTGILFARFARPDSRVEFSRWAVINDFGATGKPTFSFRIVNERIHNIVEPSVKVVLGLKDINDAAGGRKFFNLQLRMDTMPVMPSMWTLTHEITEDSPLYSLWNDHKAFYKTSPFVSVLFTGLDSVYMNSIFAHHGYFPSHMVFGDFVGTTTDNPDGTQVLDYSNFHCVEAHAD